MIIDYKNIFTNWINQVIFKLPANQELRRTSTEFTADFNQVIKFYEKEETLPAQVAHISSTNKL